MAVLLSPPVLQFFTNTGAPLSGGMLYTFVAGGVTTPKATFTDASGLVAAPNPIILDAAGRPTTNGAIWISGSYCFQLQDALGNIIDTVDNVTAFNATTAAAPSYYQAFSGNGVQTAFTLSQDLGTDENSVMVFIDNGVPTQILNGDFATDTIWTKGAGWTIGSGVATATGAISTALSQTVAIPIVQNQAYVVSYTITRSAGTITPNLGGQDGVARSVSGTFTEVISAGSTQVLSFNTAGFTGTIDIVAVQPVISQGRQILKPTEFTLTGTTITFATAPKTGTGNISIWAPSTLVAAASASAALAEGFANAANVSATNAAASAVVAANQAASFVGTSTTSVLIGTGSKSFTTQTAKNFQTGEWVTLSSNASPSNYMYGQVSSYNTGTGALVVNVTTTGGSGSWLDWNIALSGIQGVAGGITPDGDYGDILVSGGGTILTSKVSTGQCRIALSGGNIVLNRYQGNKIPINGSLKTIPSTPPSLAATGTSATTIYYIYAYMSGSTMLIEASTTGHATDSTTGVEIKSGDATRTFLGAAFVISAGSWSTETLDLVNWFNHQSTPAVKTFLANRTTTSTSAVEINPEIRVPFISLGRPGRVDYSGSVSHSVASNTVTNFVTDELGVAVATSYASSAGANGYGNASTGQPFSLAEGRHYYTILGSVIGAGTGTWYQNVPGMGKLTVTIPA